MIKKIRLLLFAFCLGGSAVQAAGPLRVVATTPDLADLARQVGGTLATVECLSRGFQDPHFVEAKPSLILKLRNADLFVQTGLDLEVGWAPLLLQGARNPRLQPGAPGFVDASTFVKILEIPTNLSRAEGAVHPGGNPHYLGDPANAAPVARGLAARMAALDPNHADVYKKNAEDFVGRLNAKIADWDKRLAPFKGAPFVSYHRNLVYFAAHFGLVSVGEIEPKPGIPPSPSHTSDLIALMKAQKVSLILTMPQYEIRTAEALARATGARVVTIALVPEAVPEAVDYLSAMESNVRGILAAGRSPS